MENTGIEVLAWQAKSLNPNLFEDEHDMAQSRLMLHMDNIHNVRSIQGAC